MSNYAQSFQLIQGGQYTVATGIATATGSGGSAAAPYTNMAGPGIVRTANADLNLINAFSTFTFPQDIQDRGFFIKGFTLPVFFQGAAPTFAQTVFRMADYGRLYRTPSVDVEGQQIIITSSSNMIHSTDGVIAPSSAWGVQTKPTMLSYFFDRAFERQQTPSGVNTPSSWQLVQRATVPGQVAPQITQTGNALPRGLWGNGANGATGQPLVGVTTQINGVNAPLPPASNLLLPETGIMGIGTGRDLTTGSTSLGQRHYSLQVTLTPAAATTGFIGVPSLIIELCS